MISRVNTRNPRRSSGSCGGHNGSPTRTVTNGLDLKSNQLLRRTIASELITTAGTTGTWARIAT